MFANRDKTEKLLKHIKLVTKDAELFYKENDLKGMRQALKEIDKKVNEALNEEGKLKRSFIAAENQIANALKKIKVIVDEL